MGTWKDKEFLPLKIAKLMLKRERESDARLLNSTGKHKHERQAI